MNKCFVYFLIFKHALAKLGKNESVTIEIIDKLCIYLKVQPSDIVEVYEIEEIDNRKIKIKTRFPDAYNFFENEIISPIASELNKYIINKNGKKVMDIEKIIEDSKKIEELKRKPETENQPLD